LPLHPFDATQELAFVELQVSVTDEPIFTSVVEALRDTAGGAEEPPQPCRTNAIVAIGKAITRRRGLDIGRGTSVLLLILISDPLHGATLCESAHRACASSERKLSLELFAV